jgi:hypothetical protein
VQSGQTARSKYGGKVSRSRGCDEVYDGRLRFP